MKTKLRIFLLGILLSTAIISCSKYDDTDIWQEIDSIKSEIAKLNSSVNSLKVVVEALEKGKTITNITQTTNGYTITFDDKTSINILGSQNSIPVVGVKEVDGIYYWTLTTGSSTDFIYDNATPPNKLPVSGIDGTTPQLSVNDEGNWVVNGKPLLDSENNPIKAVGKDGDSFFKKIEPSETEVVFTLADNTVITIPISGKIVLSIDAEKDQAFIFAQSRTYTITMTDIKEYSVSKPDGWRVNIKDNILTVIAPEKTNSYAERTGKISIVAFGKQSTVIASLNVVAVDVITGINSNFTEATSANSKYGDNLYSSYNGQKYTGYYDADSDISFKMNSTDFWSGGLVASNFNDMQTSGYTNQCSVYYSHPKTNKGGHNGSEGFIVGYCSIGGMGGGNSSMSFSNATKEATIDHVFITNSTYAVLSMKNGDQFAKKFTYEDKDWFKLEFVGYDKNGAKTGTVEFYVADFRTASAPGIITQWTKVDLTSLGKVHKVEFIMSSSDTGQYGMNTPAYFCMDDVAIIK